MYRFDHVHLKAPNPKKTAQWYADLFGAKIVGEGEGLGGSSSVRLDMDGVRIIVTSAPRGQTLPEGTADPHFGLEHFGLLTDDVEAAMARLQSHGVEVLLPITRLASGVKIAYVRAPDNVRLELVQPAS